MRGGATMRVTLPTGLRSPHDAHSGSGKDPWHQFEGLVFVLISIHVAAFVFWGWLLWKSRMAKQALGAAKKAGGGGGGSAASAAPGSSSGSAGAALTAGLQGLTQTPRDILRAYTKSSLGKH